ncbi:Signal recognition particle receptor FtsY [uncultured archaeon]|nr:Signal recognition particle receptor FtsY [uncultured archaeon]
MFKFLKEKISSWTKKISESKAKEVEVEETEEIELKEVKEKPQKKEKKKKEKKPKKEKKRKEVKEEPVEEPSKFKEAQKRPEQKEERELGEKIWEDIKEDAVEDSIKFPNFDKKEEKEPEKKGFFSKLKEKFTKTKISEEEFTQYSEDLLMILIENNVAFEVADKIITELKEKVVNKELSRKDLEEEIKNSLKETIETILVEPFDIIKRIKEKKDPYVMLFCGINGTGKTTTIAKLATLLKKEDISCVMAAGDTFRAASIEQLKLHGERTNTKVIAHDYGSDPAAVGFDAIQYAKKNNIKVVLIDTAGRMHTAKNLLKEIEKISSVCKPDVKIFVGESITGNDAVEQVKAFNESIGIDGIILSKADIDEKGGTALSVGYVTGKPILFLGMGQEYKDLELFNKKKFIEKLGL